MPGAMALAAASGALAGAPARTRARAVPEPAPLLRRLSHVGRHSSATSAAPLLASWPGVWRAPAQTRANTLVLAATGDGGASSSQVTGDSGPDRPSGAGRANGPGGRPELAARPQARRPRVPGPDGTTIPRKWHKTGAPRAPDSSPPPSPPPPSSSSSSPASAASAPAQAPAAAGPSGRPEPTRPGQGRGRPQGRPAPRRTARPVYDRYGADEYGNDEDEDDEDGELLGLSEEEMEAMVFASARSSAATAAEASTSAPATPPAPAAAAAGAEPAGKAKGRGRGRSAPSAASAAEAAAAATAAGLPPPLCESLTAAVQAGKFTGDADALTAQLQQLTAAATRHAGADSAADAAAVAAATLAAALAADAATAAAVLLNCPTLVTLQRSDLDERLKWLAFLFGSDLPGAQDAARSNPVLLLAPQEPLRRKLVTLANATGLKMPQAASMVTAYMFPGL